MRIEGLDQAIEWMGDPDSWEEPEVHTIIEVLKLVADPNIEAAAKAGYEYVHGGTRWEDAEPLDRERFIGEAERIVAAASHPRRRKTKEKP